MVLICTIRTVVTNNLDMSSAFSTGPVKANMKWFSRIMALQALSSAPPLTVFPLPQLVRSVCHSEIVTMRCDFCSAFVWQNNCFVILRSKINIWKINEWPFVGSKPCRVYGSNDTALINDLIFFNLLKFFYYLLTSQLIP